METVQQKTEKESGAKEILNINVSRIISGLTEMGNLDIDDFDTNMNISKTITNLGVVEKAYQKTTKTLMKKYISVDEKGNLVSANGFYVFNNEKDKQEYQDAIEKLNETAVTEKLWTFKASELSKVKGLKGTTLAKCQELIIDDRKTTK